MPLFHKNFSLHCRICLHNAGHFTPSDKLPKNPVFSYAHLTKDVEPKDRDIAMVFQNYALYPHMSVYDNMAFGLKLRKVPKDEIDKMVMIP